jgi:hypothetical protein
MLRVTRVIHSCPGVTKTVDKHKKIIDLEEKELADEEGVDRLLLQNICRDIMKEVMDVGGEEYVIPTKHVSKLQNRRLGVKVADRQKV